MLKQAQCPNAMRNTLPGEKKPIQCTLCIFNTGSATEQSCGVQLDPTWPKHPRSSLTMESITVTPFKAKSNWCYSSTDIQLLAEKTTDFTEI